MADKISVSELRPDGGKGNDMEILKKDNGYLLDLSEGRSLVYRINLKK